MAGSRQTNTFGEMLQKMMRDLANMKLAPDADMQFIIDMETKVIEKLRSGIDDSAQPAMSQVPGDPALGMAIGIQGQGGPMPGGPMPGGPGPMPGVGGPGAGVPNVRSTPQMPNPDELRRVLGQS